MGFEALFEAGRTFEKSTLEKVTVEPREAGSLRITSGRIAVCDPSAVPRDVALEREIPNGTYPVIVSRAHFAKIDDHRLIAAMVRFTSKPIVEWIPALPAGKNPADLEPGEYFGYGVDAGIGCFVDASLLDSIDYDLFEKAIVPKIEAVGAQCGYAEVPCGDGALLAFTTGAGDGFYTSFWGLDAEGDAAALVTEFRLAGTEVTKGGDILAKHWPGTPPPPASLSPLFELGAVFKGAKIIRLDEVGKVALPSGSLAIGQAYPRPPEEADDDEDDDGDDDGEAREPTLAEPPPSTRERFLIIDGLPAGRWPVVISIAEVQRAAKVVELPCAIAVRLSNAPITSWECAIPRGVVLAKLEPDETTGLSYDIAEGPMLLGADELLATLDEPAIQATLQKAIKPGRWSAKALSLATYPIVTLSASISSNHVFLGRAADGTIALVMTPIGQTGRERTRPHEIVQETRARLTGAGPQRPRSA